MQKPTKQNWKNHLIQGIKVMFLMLTILLWVHPLSPALVQAQTPQDTITNIGDKTQLPSFDTQGHANASAQQGASNITSAIFYVVDFIKYIMGSVAVIFIIISGIKLLTAARKIDEVAETQKEHLKYAIIGLIVIIVADQIVKAIFGDQGETFNNQASIKAASQAASEQLRGIYSAFMYFGGALAVLMIVIGGFRLVTNPGNEEVQGKIKQQVTWAIVGLILLGLAETVVKDIVFPKEGSVLSNVDKAKQLIVTMTNFISGFLSTVSVIMLIYAGYIYVVDMGKDEGPAKAKKAIAGAVIGLIVAMGAYAVVHTVIQLEPTSNVVQPASTAPQSLPTNGNIPATP